MVRAGFRESVSTRGNAAGAWIAEGASSASMGDAAPAARTVEGARSWEHNGNATPARPARYSICEHKRMRRSRCKECKCKCSDGHKVGKERKAGGLISCKCTRSGPRRLSLYAYTFEY